MRFRLGVPKIRSNQKEYLLNFRATFFFSIRPKKKGAKKKGVGRRTFIKLEIPAKLPAKNSLYQVKTVKGDLLLELSLFECFHPEYSG